MAATSLEELAAQLGRPPQSLAALAALTPPQIAQLRDAVDEACQTQARRLATEPPRWLRGVAALLFRGLRRPA